MTGDAMEALLSVRELRCGYGPCEVLAGVDLDVRPGEFVGLLGPNGSGKTTLLRAVTGVIRASGGGVDVGGAPAGRLPVRELARRAAVVPQDTAAAFPFTVREVVEMGRYPHAGPFDRPTDTDAAKVEDALARTGAEALCGRDLAALSAGERQRVLLARALAQDTPLLLVDEPTAHLDIRYQVEMLDLLRELCAGTPPRGVLAVLHDINLAARFCGRVALLKDGRIAADGPPSEVLTPTALRNVFGAEVEVIRIDGEPHVIVGRTARAVPEPTLAP